jgi:hypothetical protein
VAKPTIRKKNSASTALAGAITAFDETASPGAAHAMITPLVEVTQLVEETISPLPSHDSLPVVTEQATADKSPSPQPINFELEHYRQYLLWQQNMTAAKYQATNLTLFTTLIQEGLIPAPPQTIYFATKELRLAYMRQALLEAANQDVTRVMQALADSLNRG